MWLSFCWFSLSFETAENRVSGTESVLYLLVARFFVQQDPLEFLASELRKHFTMGDHVKVIAGRYEGDTGKSVNCRETRVFCQRVRRMQQAEL